MSSRPVVRAARATIAAAAAFALGACSEEAPDGVFIGYVEAELVIIAAPSAGWVVAAPRREGALVEPGDVLIELDVEFEQAAVDEARERFRQAEAQWRDIQTGAREEEIAALEAQLAEARAQADFAAREQFRWAALADRDVASRERAEQADAEHRAAAARVRLVQANIEIARLSGREDARAAAEAARDAAAAALAQAEWRLSERTVRARVAGRIEEALLRPGEYAVQGAPVAAVLPDDALKVRFFVPQDQIRRLRPGDRVDVLMDGAPGPMTASVSYVAREAEYTPPIIYSADTRDTLVFLVEARLEDATSARPGQPVDVRLRGGPEASE